MSLINETKRGKILITGATGQLGHDIYARLRAGGLTPLCFSREDLDITDKKAVSEVIEREAPCIVVNTAAYTKVDLAEKEREKAFAVNRDGVGNVALACRSTGAALIHISTDFVFNGGKSSPYKEDDKVDPLGVYGQSKLAGEEAVRESCPAHIIIRTSWLYGVHGPNFVKTILRLAGEREILRIVCDQVGTPTWTADLADVITKTAEAVKGGHAPFGLYHYSDEGVASWYDFALAIVEEARSLGMKLRCEHIEPIPASAYPTPATRPAYSVLDKTKIKKNLALTIPHWRNSLAGMMTELSRERGL